MNNILTLYHGSKYVIKKPIFNGGKETNDYGYGFYCTENIELAKEWACPDHIDGIANEYELDLSGLHVLDLTNRSYNILNWIALLLKYRMPEGMTPNDEQVRSYILDHFFVDLSDVDGTWKTWYSNRLTFRKILSAPQIYQKLRCKWRRIFYKKARKRSGCPRGICNGDPQYQGKP